jgi:hypothetical protein
MSLYGFCIQDEPIWLDLAPAQWCEKHLLPGLRMNHTRMIVKSVSFILLSITISTGNAAAVSMKNIDVGVFVFGLELKVFREVDDVDLDLIFVDSQDDREIKLFDGVTITDADQTFIAVEKDINFRETSILLTNKETDSIRVLIAQRPRAISIKGIEPFLLFGDFTGNNGIDFAGLIIDSIQLRITDTEFACGFDPEQGPFTDIIVEGEVTVQPRPIPISSIAESFGSSILDKNYNIFSDADRDGDVDGFDLLEIYNRPFF